MTVTETSPSVATATVEPTSPGPTPSAGIAGVLTTGEHKVLGRLYIAASLGFAVFVVVVGILASLEQTDMGGVDIVGGTEAYLQIFGLWRTGLVFLVVVPLFLGIATSVVPVQIGAPSIAFPRAAATAFWTWLLGSAVYIGSTLADGGFNAGGDTDAIVLTISAMIVMLASVLLATVCIMTTVIAQRAQGMRLTRIPLFSWTMLVTGATWLFALPVLIGNLALIWVDLRGDAVLFFETGPGGPGALRYILWAFDQPQVFVFALPLIGVVAELVPVTAHTRQRMHSGMMWSIAAFGALAFGAYAQPVYNPDVAGQPIFVVQNLLLFVPLVVLLGGWAATLSAGRPRASLALLLAAGGLLMFLAGGAIGAIRVFGPFVGGLREFDDWSWVNDVSKPFDDLVGTAVVAGQFNYVMLGGLLGGVAALYYWAPKLFGRQLSPTLGSLGGLALIGGTVLASLPKVVNGFLDEPDIATAESVRDGVEALNWVTTAGLVIVALGLLAVIVDLVIAGLESDTEVADDPWGGQTLEWATTSPPPHNNFPAAVRVKSATPLLDMDDEADADEGAD